MYAERDSSPYCVQLAADDLKWMSRTQLEDAFRREVIDQSTMVYQEGYPSWRPLRETAAIDPGALASSYYVEVVPGEVKHLTLEQIGDALRTEIIDRSTPVYCPVAREWRSLEAAIGDVATAEPEEQFHVELAPGDVKCLSLEQLDDLYRLDVIDDTAMIWREGYTSWQTLADVIRGSDAGSVEADAPPEEFYVELAPGEVQLLSLDQLDDLYRRDVIGHTTMVWQPGFASWHTLAEVAGLAATDDAAGTAGRQPLESLSLAALPEPPKVSPWFGRVLLVVAGLVAVVAGYRNDLFLQLASSIGQQAGFVELETQTLGAPGVDTPRGLQNYLEAVATRHGLRDLSPTKPVPPPEAQSASAAKGNDADAQSSEAGANDGEAKSEESSEGAGDGKRSASAKPRAAAQGSRPKSDGRGAKPGRTGSRPKPKKSVGSKDITTIGQIGGDPYDPLNGQL